MPADEYAAMARVEDDHWWYRALRDRTAALLPEPSRGWRLLDAGCGTGAGMRLWSARATAIGLDLSREALSHCARRGVRDLVQGSIEHVPLRSASVDTAISLDVICLIGIDERDALRELYRVLRPGGTLVLNLPAFSQLRGQHDQAVLIRRRYTKQDIATMLESAGFVVARIAYWNTLLFPLVWAVRRLRRPTAPRPTSDLSVLPRLVNEVLLRILRVETFIFRQRAPFGTSVMAVARRPLS